MLHIANGLDMHDWWRISRLWEEFFNDQCLFKVALNWMLSQMEVPMFLSNMIMMSKWRWMSQCLGNQREWCLHDHVIPKRRLLDVFHNVGLACKIDQCLGRPIRKASMPSSTNEDASWVWTHLHFPTPNFGVADAPCYWSLQWNVDYLFRKMKNTV